MGGAQVLVQMPGAACMLEEGYKPQEAQLSGAISFWSAVPRKSVTLAEPQSLHLENGEEEF